MLWDLWDLSDWTEDSDSGLRTQDWEVIYLVSLNQISQKSNVVILTLSDTDTDIMLFKFCFF